MHCVPSLLVGWKDTGLGGALSMRFPPKGGIFFWSILVKNIVWLELWEGKQWHCERVGRGRSLSTSVAVVWLPLHLLLGAVVSPWWGSSSSGLKFAWRCEKNNGREEKRREEKWCLAGAVGERACPAGHSPAPHWLFALLEAKWCWRNGSVSNLQIAQLGRPVRLVQDKALKLSQVPSACLMATLVTWKGWRLRQHQIHRSEAGHIWRSRKWTGKILNQIQNKQVEVTEQTEIMFMGKIGQRWAASRAGQWSRCEGSGAQVWEWAAEGDRSL